MSPISYVPNGRNKLYYSPFQNYLFQWLVIFESDRNSLEWMTIKHTSYKSICIYKCAHIVSSFSFSSPFLPSYFSCNHSGTHIRFEFRITITLWHILKHILESSNIPCLLSPSTSILRNMYMLLNSIFSITISFKNLIKMEKVSSEFILKSFFSLSLSLCECVCVR